MDQTRLEMIEPMKNITKWNCSEELAIELPELSFVVSLYPVVGSITAIHFHVLLARVIHG